MRSLYLIVATLATSTSAFAYEPAQERDFAEFAASGCRNRDGDFIIRGVVSSANDETVVLSDPTNSRSTTSITLPGKRGPFARVRSAFGTSRQEAGNEQLNELRMRGTPVVVTLECNGDGTPLAREIRYTNSDGSHAAISY